LLVVLICAEVALRNLHLGNIPWSVEASEYALYAMTLLGAPWVLSLRGHVRMDLLVSSLPAHQARRMDIAVNLLGAVICAVLVWKGIDVTATAYERGALVFKTLIFPEWWLLVALPVTMAMLCLGFLRLAVEGVLGIEKRGSNASGGL
jgi:TRAP-type C4-dicarboxylate transport system permease small subunit